MEKHEELFAKAKRESDLADHLLYVTYPLVKETKFLLAITEHIIRAAKLALRALLEYERYYKRLEPFPKKFGIEIELFREKPERRYGFDPRYFRLLRRLQELEVYRAESPMMFKRKDKYILTDREYNIKTIDVEKVKKYNNLVKGFIRRVEAILKSKD